MNASPSPGASHRSSHHYQLPPPIKSPVNGRGRMPLEGWPPHHTDSTTRREQTSGHYDWDQRRSTHQQQNQQHQQHQHQPQMLIHPDHPHHLQPPWGPSPPPPPPSRLPRPVPDYHDGYSYRSAPTIVPEDRSGLPEPRKQHRKTQSREFLPPPLPPTIGNGNSARLQSRRDSTTNRYDPASHHGRSMAPPRPPSPPRAQQHQSQQYHPPHQYDHFSNANHEQEWNHKRKRSEGPDQHGGVDRSIWGSYPAASPRDGSETRHDPRAWSQPYESEAEQRRQRSEGVAGGMGPPTQKKSSSHQPKNPRSDSHHHHVHGKSVDDTKSSELSYRPPPSPVRRTGPPLLSNGSAYEDRRMSLSPSREPTESSYPYDPYAQSVQQTQLQRQRQQSKAEEKLLKQQALDAFEARQRKEASRLSREEQLEAERRLYEMESTRGAISSHPDALEATVGYAPNSPAPTYPLSNAEDLRHRTSQPEQGMTAIPSEAKHSIPTSASLPRDPSQTSQYIPQQGLVPPPVPQQRIISDAVWAWFDEFILSATSTNDEDPPPARFLGSWVYEPWKQPLLPAGMLAGNVAALVEVRISGSILGLYRETSDPRAPSGWTLGWRARQAGVRVDIQDAKPLGEEEVKEQKATNRGRPFWSQRGLEERKLWGSEVYTDDSDVLAMCVHSGWIEGPANVPIGAALTSGTKETGQPNGDDESPLYLPPDLKVTLRVAPRLVSYRESCGGGLWSRNWLGMHDGVSLLVERVDLEKSGYSSPSSLPGARGLKNGATTFVSLQKKMDSLALLDRSAAKVFTESSTTSFIPVLDDRKRSVFPLSEVGRGIKQGAVVSSLSSPDPVGLNGTKGHTERFWWKVSDVVAQRLEEATSVPTLEAS